jgi:hypothetical protein
VAPRPAGSYEPELAFVGGVEHDVAVTTAPTLEDPSRFAVLPVEVGFHCQPRGFADLLEGRMTLSAFRTAMRERWWPERVERIATAEQLAASLERLEDAYPADPVGSCRRLFCELVGPFAEREGRVGVVEHSGGALANAPTLERVFAEATFVHVLRDGREVAASRVARAEGPPGERPPGAHAVLEALEWWAEELQVIDSGVRVQEDGAEYGVWPDRLRVMLVADRPEPGEWERGLTSRERRRVRRRYRRILAELADRGVHCAPQLIAAYEA